MKKYLTMIRKTRLIYTLISMLLIKIYEDAGAHPKELCASDI